MSRVHALQVSENKVFRNIFKHKYNEKINNLNIYYTKRNFIIYTGNQLLLREMYIFLCICFIKSHAVKAVLL
jgi:hypothetical protein